MRQGLIMALLLAGLTAGCGEKPVVVGSKDSAENRIAAEMLAGVLEQADIPVHRRLGLGDSPETLSALRAGSIDLYPEYTGTALGLLGAPATADAERALATARAGFEPLGLRFLAPLGYESTYVVVVRRELADRVAPRDVSGLAGLAADLRLGVTEAFADRPGDGLDPFLDRFGLVFAGVTILPDSQRTRLYADLLDGDLDVVVGFSTDPEIGDYGLTTLAPDRPFFPAYAAVPLVSAATLRREPEVAASLARLAGKLSDAAMRDLVRQVQVFGRAPELVARQALADLGLGAGEPAASLPSFGIAVDAATVPAAATARMLRAVREAVAGREVTLVATDHPTVAVAERQARIAHVPAVALFEFTDRDVVRRDDLEVVAVTGASGVLALAAPGGPDRLSRAASVATGPVGSPSWKIGSVASGAGGRSRTVVPLADTSVGAAAAAVRAGRAEIALVVVPRGDDAVARVLADDPPLRLADAADWWQGPERLALPFLRRATLPAGTIPQSAGPVETLAMQTVLVGPAPPPGRVVGIMGPGTYAVQLQPLRAQTVRAIGTALGDTPDVDPHLRAAAVLQPRPPAAAPRALTRPDEAVLTVAILAFLVGCGWLFRRGPLSRTP